MDAFLLTFIPLFVAIDVFGVLPLFVGLTDGMDASQKRKLTRDAVFTAFAVSLLFLATGKLIFSFLGITESDFRVGGGVVLLVLAVHDIVAGNDDRRIAGSTVGVVPIGIPLIMGPAGLTTVILLVDSFGYLWTVVSLVVNMAIVWAVFAQSDRIGAVVGEGGSRAVAKVAALLLTGIAVMLIRSGIEEMVR